MNVHLSFFCIVTVILLAAILVFSCSSPKGKPGDYDSYPVYRGKDLGLTYGPESSLFKIWSPFAKKVVIHFYDAGIGGERKETVEMKSGENGTWEAKIKKDLAGLFYTYQVQIDSVPLPETQGIYARAVGVNGNRAAVIDISKTNPEGWMDDRRPPLNRVNDIILYETQIRDFTMSGNSGNSHPGKYLGVGERGTKNTAGQSTGIDHLQALGITHLHLLPVFDHRSIDETKLDVPQYNWGYDPKNYNVPEGSFSTDPYNPSLRITEFKKMVMDLHAAGIRVIMDVVYNHTGETANSAFNLEVPGYYYRHKADGSWSDASACGNETASERSMMRKYIIESCKYWVQEYHVDGFRFDLMGIHDIETMTQIRDELKYIDSSIFLYGEGWTAGSSPLPDSARATKANMPRLLQVAAFSDDLRDGIKGSVFEDLSKGFVNGGADKEMSVQFGIVAATRQPQIDYTKVNYSKAPWAKAPDQCINYVSCHDNHTLYDKLVLTGEGKVSESDLIKMDKMAAAIVLTSQGIPFLHAGEEMLRSKSGEHNSFNKPDAVNQIDWDRKSKYKDVHEFYRGMILLRKSHPAFKMTSAELIKNNLSFMEIGLPNVVGYTLSGKAAGDLWSDIVVIFNSNRKSVSITIPPGNWNIAVDGDKVYSENFKTLTGGTALIPPLSTWILFR